MAGFPECIAKVWRKVVSGAILDALRFPRATCGPPKRLGLKGTPQYKHPLDSCRFYHFYSWPMPMQEPRLGHKG